MVTETEFVETINIMKAANLMKAKGTVEKMFQELVALREQLKQEKQEKQEKKDAKPSTTSTK